MKKLVGIMSITLFGGRTGAPGTGQGPLLWFDFEEGGGGKEVAGCWYESLS